MKVVVAEVAVGAQALSVCLLVFMLTLGAHYLPSKPMVAMVAHALRVMA